MANGKKSFTAYCDWKETFNSLPDDKAGQLIKHLFAYVNDENPETDDILIKAVFAQIKATLKRDLKKWESKREQNRENALIRWNKKDANVCERINKDANDAVSDSVSDSVSDNKIIDDVYNKFVKEVKEGLHDISIEALYIKLKLKKGSLTPLLKDFKCQLLIDNKVHKNTLELRKHFSNWLNTQDKIGKLNGYRNKSMGSL